jgi:hypothetical protein
MAKASQITFKSDSWFFMYLHVSGLLSVPPEERQAVIRRGMLFTRNACHRSRSNVGSSVSADLDHQNPVNR